MKTVELKEPRPYGIADMIGVNAPLFDLGSLAATAGALRALMKHRNGSRAAAMLDIANMLRRHCGGDWGELCAEDCEANDDAVTQGGRILSAYRINALAPEKAGMVWIITEADRSVTTVLLPEEY